MTTYTLKAELGQDKKLRLEVPCDFPPGQVEVVVIVHAQTPLIPGEAPRWDDLYGLGKDVWQGIDALKYVRELREDRDLHR